MSFQQTLISYSEIKTGIACKLLATEHCLTLFNWVKKNHPEMLVKNNPLSGAIAIWQHGDTQKGHTGLVLDSDENIFYAVEGNASGYLSKEKAISGKINREGNGVFYTKRSRAGDGNMKLLGFIKPWEYPS
jgi:hypothetical protein